MTDKQVFVLDRRIYEWCGGFGAIFTSEERGVRQGDVRMIFEELFYAYMVRRGPLPWSRSRVSWTQPDVTMEHIREIKAKAFNIERPVADISACVSESLREAETVRRTALRTGRDDGTPNP